MITKKKNNWDVLDFFNTAKSKKGCFSIWSLVIGRWAFGHMAQRNDLLEWPPNKEPLLNQLYTSEWFYISFRHAWTKGSRVSGLLGNENRESGIGNRGSWIEDPQSAAHITKIHEYSRFFQLSIYLINYYIIKFFLPISDPWSLIPDPWFPS